MFMTALLTITRRIGNRMSFCRCEPTMAEIFSIVQAVMEADGVDPKRLEALLRSMAQNLAEVRQVGS
jgi:hypothetical protein